LTDRATAQSLANNEEDIPVALDKARSLLSGELSGQHSKLTDFFRQKGFGN
jgi:hypothetical protein